MARIGRARPRGDGGRDQQSAASMLLIVALIILCGNLVTGRTLPGQSVSGRVREGTSQGAIARAEVTLLDSAGATLSTTRTSDSGEYRLRLPGAGRYRLTARRVGFRSALSPWLSLESGDGALSFDFLLDAAPQSLAEVKTEAKGDEVKIHDRFGLDTRNINAFTVSPEKVREYAESANGLVDVLRHIGIPGGLAVREEDSGEPCIVLTGRDRHCMLIIVDNIVTDHVRDLDLNTILDIVVMRPNEAGLWFGALSSNGGVGNPNQRSTAGGVLLIRTKLGAAKKDQK